MIQPDRYTGKREWFLLSDDAGSRSDAARARFVELLTRDDDAIELDRVALAIASAEYPTLDTAAYLAQLDRLAAELRPRLSPEESPERLIAVLNAFLFGEEAFHGNAHDYYDPRNSYLNEVLDRRTGIPITLALVYIELGRRVGLRLDGIGLPGHFIVRCNGASDNLLIDPFNRGAVLTTADCADRVRQLYGNSLRFSPELVTMSRRDIVTRMLRNLKGCYLRKGDLLRALRAVEWTVLADPRQPEELREMGLLRYRLGDLRGAAADLERFIEQAPPGRLVDQTRDQLRRVQEFWVRRN
jgi:regulator of sirC expression with transglutaminase-like and TPR domain